jgi:AcrR family transcriptional regulator
MDTKQKILDTAERLIATQGFAATSLRQIISEAAVNLAAVHYHFGTKQDLLDQIILRKASGVNAERVAILDRLEKESSSRGVPVARILDAFFAPMIRTGSQNPQFVKLMGRMHAEGLLPAVIEKHFQPTAMRFVNALHRALPELSEGELFWRMQFMYGAMSQAVCGWDTSPVGLGIRGDGADFGRVMRRLLTFLSAGFGAPPTAEDVAASFAGSEEELAEFLVSPK